MSYAWAVWAWVLSGGLHLFVGGYLGYRFGPTIEPYIMKALGWLKARA